ncbi:MAG TPA: hypothetical protein VEK11_22685 [Thermoanaerobaculia bacterium]|nr:hypothetical protein [Thermoanaerobaculia bacterium]
MKRAIAILLLLTACSSDEPAATNTTTASESAAAAASTAPPTADQARALIEKSGEFSQHEFTFASVSMPVSGAAMNEATRATARQLVDAGWLSLDPGTNDIMLTEKSRGDKRFILRENGLLDVVPLAKKEMGTVEAVRKNPDGTLTVDFNWKWLPNEVGQSFKTGAVHDRFAATQNAKANLMWNGTEWVMLSVETR